MQKINNVSALWKLRMALFATVGSFFGEGRRAGIKLEHVGYGLAVAGGVLAMIAFLGIAFIPVATLAVIYWEILALLGAILLVIGLVVHAAE